ncbi:hypothetical protein [Streptomyces sp. NPDC050848]|uniref:hypothetical protein n=1 Tax=Streptomyces sp. NPDC050848 TaxID=3155791 RepID=UPI003411E52C
MPPDHVSNHKHEGSRPELFDRTIPLGEAGQTRNRRDFQVNMQVGPLLAASVVGIALWYAPQEILIVVGLAAFLVAAARRSYFRYRRLRTE